MKFQPRPVRGRADFSFKEALEVPGAVWRVVEAPGAPWNGLEAPGNPPTCMDEAEQPVQTLVYTMAYNIYYVLFMGFAFWVHLIGICGGL